MMQSQEALESQLQCSKEHSGREHRTESKHEVEEYLDSVFFFKAHCWPHRLAETFVPTVNIQNCARSSPQKISVEVNAQASRPERKSLAMDQDQIARALNEWMRRYIADPAAFDAEFQTVGEFLKDEEEGR
jgi:hypothetical protein